MNVESYWLQNIFVSYPFSIAGDDKLGRRNIFQKEKRRRLPEQSFFCYKYLGTSKRQAWSQHKKKMKTKLLRWEIDVKFMTLCDSWKRLHMKVSCCHLYVGVTARQIVCWYRSERFLKITAPAKSISSVGKEESKDVIIFVDSFSTRRAFSLCLFSMHNVCQFGEDVSCVNMCTDMALDKWRLKDGGRLWKLLLSILQAVIRFEIFKEFSPCGMKISDVK